MRHVACMGWNRKACKIFCGNPERKRPFRRYRYKQESNIEMDMREIGRYLDRIHLSQDRDL